MNRTWSFGLGGSGMVLLGVGAVLTIASGALAGEYGVTALMGITALVAALLVFHRPLLGLAFLVFLIPIQNVVTVSSGVTLAKLAGVGVFAAWIVQKLFRGETFSRVLTSEYTWVGGIFITLALGSELWARVPGLAVNGFQQLALLFGFGILVIDIVRDWDAADYVVRGLVLGGLASAFLTLQQSMTPGVQRAGDNVAGGINANASLLLILLPFAFYLLRCQYSRGWRVVGLVYIVTGPLAILTSLSRFNMLLLPLVLVALCLETWLGRRGRGSLIVIGAVAVVGGTAFIPWDRVQDRASTIMPYFSDLLGAEVVADATDEASSGRGFHLRVGLAIARDHPILGAGFDNFGVLFRDEYQFLVPGMVAPFGSARSPHSSYVGILAELGVVGVALWVVLLFWVGLWRLAGAIMSQRRNPASRGYVLSRALAYALGLQALAYGWYAPTHQSTLLWAVLGLSVAAGSIAMHRALPAGEATATTLRQTEGMSHPQAVA